MPADSAPEDRKYQHRYEPPFWEKAVAAAGFLLLLALLSYLLTEALAGNHLPPDIRIDVQQIRASGEDYLVVFEARNTGGQTAAAVTVTATLYRGGHAVETREATLDFVPAASTRTAGVYFRNNPRDFELRLAPASYSRP